jgi:hypothetical protein
MAAAALTEHPLITGAPSPTYLRENVIGAGLTLSAEELVVSGYRL